ncbi:hypothetical protein [Streptomyces sp. NPDC047070]|uniref:hypothetical protein n=1 Tax=Streptomyces sp. NPDC047070 TaxID=3154923 RepID=UPI003453DD8C
MQKIPTLFVRDPHVRRQVLREVRPGCGWVTRGEGRATVMWSGLCVMLDDNGEWWTRRRVAAGKTPPAKFQLVHHNERTRKSIGWEPSAQCSYAKTLAEAIDATDGTYQAGTYDLCGPHLNNNADGFGAHVLMKHGWSPLSARMALEESPRDFDGLRSWLPHFPYKGIVWHHPDGRMAKLKARDVRHVGPA